MGEKTKDKLSRYTDPTGEFSNRSLKLAEWYLKHKLLLQKIGKYILVAWCVVTVGYGFGYLGYYFSYGYFQDQKMAAQSASQFQNYKNLQQMYGAKDLVVKDVDVYNSVSDLYDFAARVENPNERWVAKVTYKFQFSGGETSLAATVIPPQSARPMVLFGAAAGSYPVGARMVIEKVDWRRLNPHVDIDIKNYIAERSKFSVERFAFTPASRSAGILNNMIEFDLFNDTAYGFWDAEFYVELKDGGETVGLIHLNVDKFKTGEKRHIDLRSFVDNLRVSDIVVWPVFDVFDNNEYMPAGE